MSGMNHSEPAIVGGKVTRYLIKMFLNCFLVRNVFTSVLVFSLYKTELQMNKQDTQVGLALPTK